jgi:hypothetical protein
MAVISGMSPNRRDVWSDNSSPKPRASTRVMEAKMFRRNDREPNSRVNQLSTAETAVRKLRALTQGLESVSPFDDQNAASRRRRLLRVREGIASITKKLARPFCNCRFSTEVDIEHTEEFEAKMNVPCPIHGPCRLGVLIIISVHGSDSGKARLGQLIQEYARRCQLWKEGVRNEGSL